MSNNIQRFSNFRTFKSYYIECIQGRYRKYFPKAVSYNRFLELMEYALFPLLLYTLKFKNGKCTGISFIDSTTLDVCDSHRIHCNKVFKGLAKRGKSSIMNLYDKVILRKRAVIESVNDFLKNICQIEHSRHRKPLNFLINLVGGIAAYSFLPKKPSLKLEIYYLICKNIPLKF